MGATTTDKKEAAETDKLDSPSEQAETKVADTLSDEDYWENMIFVSRGPSGWNIGCGCG